MKPLKVGVDPKKVAPSQSPVFPLKIGEDKKKKSSRPQNAVFFAKSSKISTGLKNKHVS